MALLFTQQHRLLARDVVQALLHREPLLRALQNEAVRQRHREH